jgi:hypothetical protein
MAAGSGDRLLSHAASLGFALVVVAIAVAINRPLWRLPADRISDDAAPVAARRNARLMALTYAWGAAGMLAVYTLSPLRWYHYWQYAIGMALLAALLLAYGARIANPRSELRQPALQLAALRLTVIQGMLALGGAGFLVLSEKLASTKPDWAASNLFLAGALAVALISALAAFTQIRLKRPR